MKIQDGGHLWRHLCNSGCHGNQLNTTWFRLIESTKEAYYMYQKYKSDEQIIVSKVNWGGGGFWLTPQVFM